MLSKWKSQDSISSNKRPISKEKNVKEKNNNNYMMLIQLNNNSNCMILFHQKNFQNQIHYISELEARLAVYAHLAQAMDDVKLGRTQAMDGAFDDILAELDEVRP